MENSKRKPLWTYVLFPFGVVSLLLLIHGVSELFGLHWQRFGLYPRDWNRWYGIFTFFFLHGSWEHVANNAIGLLVLLSLLRYFFPTAFFKMLIVSMLIPGLITFIIAREANHIGASGAVYTLASFLFFSSLIRFNRYLLALSLLIVFLFGGLWWGVFPIEDHVSYEGHFSGAITGLVGAIYFRKAQISPDVIEPEPLPEAPEEDIIGDAWKTTYPTSFRYTYSEELPNSKKDEERESHE